MRCLKLLARASVVVVVVHAIEPLLFSALDKSLALPLPLVGHDSLVLPVLHVRARLARLVLAQAPVLVCVIYISVDLSTSVCVCACYYVLCVYDVNTYQQM